MPPIRKMEFRYERAWIIYSCTIAVVIRAYSLDSSHTTVKHVATIAYYLQLYHVLKKQKNGLDLGRFNCKI